MSTTAALHEGPEVPEVSTEELGFKALNGDKRARIPQAVWSEDNLPPSYASLLSIAPAHGLFATAGPEYLVVGQTKTIRDKIWEKLDGGDAVRDYEPLLAIPHSRIAHVAFSCDETCLVLAEESSNGCVVYGTPELAAKRTNIALRVGTNAPLRAIVPNPDPVQASLFALLTTNGDLFLTDLSKGGDLQQGVNGQSLASNASCVCWSNRGKQLLVGQADGTILQIKPDGSLVAAVPKPHAVPTNCHVTQLSWLENNEFFAIYTPSTVGDEMPVSEYFMITTDKSRSQFTFSRVPELIYAMVQRYPACFYATRLKKWAPHLDDMLVISGTVGPDVAILAKSSKTLGIDAPTDTYVWASPLADSSKATLPVGESGDDTTPIGAAFDYSDQDGMINPIAGEDIERTDKPLPELIIINNEGMYNVWAVIYNDGIKENTLASGFELVNEIRQNTGGSQIPMGEQGTTSSVHTNAPSAAPEASMAEDNPSRTASSAFGNPTSTFGNMTSSGASPFDNKNNEKPAWASSGFGVVSNTQSSSTGPSTFGTPAFGAPAGISGGSNPTFGKPSLFGGSARPAQASPAFGQTAFGGDVNTPSPFGNVAASRGINTSSGSSFGGATSGFGAFANQSGFASASKGDISSSPFATKTASEANVFGKPSTSTLFGQTNSASSPFGQLTTDKSTVFGAATGTSTFGKPSTLGSLGGAVNAAPSPFSQKSTETSGSGLSKPFSLGSTFVKDPTSKEEEMADESAGTSDLGFGFGSDFSSTMKPSKAPSAPIDDDSMEETVISEGAKQHMTPPSTIAGSKTITPTPHVQSVFGADNTPQTGQKSNLFGGFASTTPKDTPAPSKFMFGTKPIDKDTPALVQKSEPTQIANPFASLMDKDSDSANTTKNERQAQTDDAPLPPDFVMNKTKPDETGKVPGPGGTDKRSTSDKQLASAVSPLKSPSAEGVEAEDAPLPPDFVPANKTATSNLTSEESAIPLSEEEESDFEDSGEDVTGDISSPDVPDRAGNEVEPVQTSPESSAGRISEQSETDSPTGGPFTKVKLEASKLSKPLFGEIPLFTPPVPKPQESPRSPSPLRKPMPHDYLRSPRSPERSFSAPAHPRSILAQRKLEHQQSPFAAQAARVREEEIAKEKARLQAAQVSREKAEAAELTTLEDDEDEILRVELAKPAQPQANLDPFMSVTPGKTWTATDDGKHDVPSQIEKLYRDVNSMVVTVGINARSLTSYMLYQSESELSDQWPGILSSNSPSDANELPLRLGDATRLPAGYSVLEGLSREVQIPNILERLEACQTLQAQDISSLRNRITALRRSTEARLKTTDNSHAPLSAEQVSIQQDLRKLSALVLTQLQQLEESLVVLRAKLAEVAPANSESSSSQKRPTLEAVVNTINKMTAMAERKSADVVFLESQLRKLDLIPRPRTPEKQVVEIGVSTPKSAASSVYHTPESSRSRASSVHSSARSSSRHSRQQQQTLVVSAEDKQRWTAKVKRKKAIAEALRDVLREKHES